MLFEHPIIDVRAAEKMLGTSYVTASQAVSSLEELGYLTEITGQKRNKIYRFSRYLGLFEEPEPATAEEEPADVTDHE
jgi:hypothetical protein